MAINEAKSWTNFNSWFCNWRRWHSISSQTCSVIIRFGDNSGQVSILRSVILDNQLQCVRHRECQFAIFHRGNVHQLKSYELAAKAVPSFADIPSQTISFIHQMGDIARHKCFSNVLQQDNTPFIYHCCCPNETLFLKSYCQ